MNSRKMITNFKRRGERAELQFMAKAARFGLGVSKPPEFLFAVVCWELQTGNKHFVKSTIASQQVAMPQGCPTHEQAL